MERMGEYKFFLEAPTSTIQEGITRTQRILTTHNNICCGVSGGSDSDDMLRVVWELDVENKVRYFFVDTGLEMQATKDHIKYLQKLYGIKIETLHPRTPCAVSVKRNGYPVFSKVFAEYIHRLQIHDFDWKDGNFDGLPKTGVKWWTSSFVDGEHIPNQREIGSKKYLKEFMTENPPNFKISAHCCDDCKKEPLGRAEKGADLVLTGVRRSEGGARSIVYKSCFVEGGRYHAHDTHMPLFWWTNEDKKEFDKKFNIVHSRAYTEYGLKRTGCAGCPFSSRAQSEIDVLKKYEPNLAKAVENIFAPSYEYQEAYRKYREERKKNGG